MNVIEFRVYLCMALEAIVSSAMLWYVEVVDVRFWLYLCHSLFTLSVLPSYSNKQQVLKVKVPSTN